MCRVAPQRRLFAAAFFFFSFFSSPGLRCHSQSPSGHVGLRNKRDEEGAAGEGSR